MPAFRIGPADHDEFLAVQAFDLEPQAAVDGRVGGIGAFGDDPLDRQCVSPFMESRALTAMIIVVMQGRRGLRQQRGEARLALDQRLSADVVAVEMPASEAPCIMPNEVMPSGKTPHNSPSR